MPTKKKRPTRRASAGQPTEAELEILEVLWEIGPCALGQIHEALADKRSGGYTTTQKMVQVMGEKGLVVKDDSVRPHLYRSAEPRERTQFKLLDYVRERAFGGSAKELILSAVSGRNLTKEELAEIKRQINAAQRQEGAES